MVYYHSLIVFGLTNALLCCWVLNTILGSAAQSSDDTQKPARSLIPSRFTTTLCRTTSYCWLSLGHSIAVVKQNFGFVQDKSWTPVWMITYNQ
jgi:hypothetical protein